MKTKKLICLLLAILTIVFCFGGCTPEKEDNTTASEKTELGDMSGKKMGIITGSIFSVMLPKLFPDAIFLEFNTYADILPALENGKVDVIPADESVYKSNFGFITIDDCREFQNKIKHLFWKKLLCLDAKLMICNSF